MFPSFSPLRAVSFVSSNRKVVISILAAVSLTATIWFGLQRVQSAPPEFVSPQFPPASPAKPVVTLEVPAEVLIGEPMKFKVKFKNAGTAVGYGPFVDLVLDAGGANIKLAKTPNCACDGIKFVSAQVVDINPPGGPLALPASPINTTPCGTTLSNIGVSHPFAGSGVNAVDLPLGAQLVTLALPFGSFEPDQPEIVVEVTANVSNLADANFPLKISARGGFQFGALDALDNPGPPTPDPPILSDESSPGIQGVNSVSWIAQATTTPTVMIIKKAYSGPEDETATGPNFPHLYTLTVDIANTQTVSNVILTDCLPDNMAFVQFISITPAGTSNGPIVGSAGSPNCFTVTWPTLIGGLGPDATVVFEFFIPDVDANGDLILKPDCKNVLSNNKITATGLWTPTDPCDTTPPPPVTVTSKPDEHILTDKCIAIQKSVAMFTDTGAPGFTPGDILLYTLNFQISDFKTLGDLEVVDRLSDGQSLFITPATMAKLSVMDQYGPTSGDFVLTTDLIKTTSSDSAKKCGVATGVTELTFKISQKMMSFAPTTRPRHDAGILTGGRATSNTVALGAIGKIEFFVKIDDEFAFTQIGDKFVDKEDPINNCVDISGTVMTNVNQETPVPVPESPMVTAHDDSGTAIALVGDTLTKVVYSVQRAGQFICAPSSEIISSQGDCSNLPGLPQEVRPGDDVTFRIEKKIPSTDAEQLTIEDWLPLPIFNVTGFTSTNAHCAPATVPLVNQVCFHPLDTLSNPFPPNFMPVVASNSIKFEYGNISDMNNVGRKIDLLFTSTVTNDPFADKLFLTNEVRECEKNTFGDTFCQVAIAQVNLREPNLKIRKGVIATNNPNGLFSQPASPQTIPNPTALPPPGPPGATLSLTGITGVVNSNDLATGVLDSKLDNVDANDLVTFAITIENQGGHPAFDVKLEDIIPTDTFGDPSCFTIDQSSIKVQLGTGVTVSPTLYVLTPTISGGFSLTLLDSIPELNATNATTGDNIIVITFQVKLKADITPGCCQNQAKITHYASIANGSDFVAAGFNGPYDDSAEVCIKPTLTKSVVATSEAHTAPETAPPGTPQVAIGEIVRYHLDVVVPEGGLLTSVKLTDVLPSGMIYLDDNTARIAFVSNQTAFTHPAFVVGNFDVNGNSPQSSTVLNGLDPLPSGVPPPTFLCGGGATLATFNLGDIKNNDNNDSDLEYVSLEFNALVCNVTGNQQPGNQPGTPLPDTISMSVGGANIANSNTITVSVVEPNLTIGKSVSPTTVVQGVTVTYTVTITNSSLVDAFDVQFSDALPLGLNFVPSSVMVTGSCTPPTGISTAAPLVTCAEIPVGGVVTITYKALAFPYTCPVTLTNNARVTWTSLPGPKGTTSNSTMSSTPGNSGAPDGERDGSNPPLNDYVASASAPLTVLCPPCAKAPPDMVAWWPLDEPNGSTVVNDIAGVNNQGKPTPGITLGSPNAPNPVFPGFVVGAMNFDSNLQTTGPNIEVPNDPEISFGMGDLAIDTWVFVPKPPAIYIHPIVDKLDVNSAGTQGTGYAFYLVSSFSTGARLQFVMGDGGLLANYISLNVPSVLFNTWTHVAVTVNRSSKTVVFYVNGVPDGATIDPSMPTGSLFNTLPLLIGESRLPGLSQAAITLDEVEMFKRAITQTEIEDIYNARSSGKCKCPPITLNPPAGALPAGVVNIPYSQTFTATGGCSSSSFTYTVTGGVLPPGLTLSANGVLSGTPKQPGVFTFTITATDKCGCTKSQTYTLTIDCPLVPLPLFNTGVANDGSLLASGATDAHFVLVPPSPVLPDAIVPAANQIPPPPIWLANGPSSQWIGPDVNPLINSPAGDYTYQVTFNMPAGADLSTAIIAGQWASDNDAEIFLNGVSTGWTTGPGDFGFFTPFVITGPIPFVPNMNTLEFRVHNISLQTGLRVEMTGSVRCCPPTKADKCVITTSELHTMPANSNNGTPQVAIGEIIRYRLTATLTEGGSPFFRFTDHLPPGLTYLGNPKVAFVSFNGLGISSDVPALSGSGLNVNASSVGACSGPTPTFDLPAIQVTGGAFSSGTDPTFNLGSLTNTHTDPNLEYVIVEFNALVNNLPANAPGPPNQNGATLSNFYDVFIGSGTPPPIATSTPSNVTVVEPDLVVQKKVGPIGPTGLATFTVTLTNSGTAAAFDVQINDVLPAGFGLTTPAPFVSVSPGSCAQPALTVSGNALTVTAPTMPVGCSVTLTFTVVVSSTCSPEPNIAQVSYTSLPGGPNSPVGTQPNSTGSVTPGPTGAVDGDRLYNASAQASLPSLGVGGACQPSCGCPLKISRFRENGPAGTADEFVEIFNPSDSPVLVSTCSNDPATSANGIGVFASAGNGFNPQFGQAANVASLVCQIPGSTVIAGRGYYLCGGKDYSLGGLGNNGATSHSVPDQTIGAGNAATGTSDIPNDAGLALLNIGSNIVTPCVPGSLGCCSGFNYPDPGGGGTGSAAVYDKVGFGPYGPGSPLNVPTYPSQASQYCEATCLQPVGDASIITLGPNQLCPTTVGPPMTSFPVSPGGTISAVPFCYGESGQYEILRRQTTWSSTVGTLHQDTDNNPEDFILVSPDPATGNVGLTFTGISGVTSVLGAAGPYNTIAPPDMLNFTQAFFPALTLNTTVPQPNPVNPENDPLGTVTFRLSYTNNSPKTITGLRFKVDNLSTLCGNQRLIPNSALSIPGNANARNLLVSPTCGTSGNSAILKALNSLTTSAIVNSSLQIFHGTVLEDLSVGPLPPGALSPFAGGVDSSFVLIDDSASNPLGDGVTGGKGKFAITIFPGGVIYVQFRFGKVRTNAPFQFLITPMATTMP